MATSGSVSRARAQRRKLTPPEARLWLALKGRAVEGIKFRRQHPVGPYILDFYCASARLAVEVDGLGHNEPGQSAHDGVCDHRLKQQGVRVLRIAAEDVRLKLDEVVEQIRRHAQKT